MSTLYRTTGAWRAIEQALDESGGEETPEIAAMLAAFSFEDAENLAGAAEVIENFEARAAARKARGNELLAAARADSATVARIKGRVLQYLQETGKRDVEADGWKFRRQLNGQCRVEVADVSALPAELRREVVTLEADKASILLWHEQNRPLPPGVTVSRGEHVRLI